MGDWHYDLKAYPHFDKFLPPDKIEAIVKDPSLVRANKFFPFLRYEKGFRPFRLNDKPRKIRPIRYASRRDSNIFSYYRYLLSAPYEAELLRTGLSENVIAYRKIISGPDGRGKCNIHFAKGAFDQIVRLGNCCAVALDISSYFESIDHARLRELWCRMLRVENLPPDHATVFKNITNYAFVDREKVYERLGYFGARTVNGNIIRGYIVPFKEMPMQLCAPAEFRKKILGEKSSDPTLIQKNNLPYGIPQGAPISDLLANLYLLDFDIEMNTYARNVGGLYVRYSDDILFVIPGCAQEGKDARDYAINRITTFGSELKIKPEKSSIVRYVSNLSGAQNFEHIDGAQGRNGLEYLGFRFDGRNVYIRDSTISGFNRKISRAVGAAANAYVARYNGKDIAYLHENFDYAAFTKKFGRVEDFDEDADYRTWTFWSYAKRAAETFAEQGQPIFRQIKGHKKKIRQQLRNAIERAHAKKPKSP